MEQGVLEAVHTTLIGFTMRAERATEESLVATFVDLAPLFSLLSTENNQVIYGRRGTGKLMLFRYSPSTWNSEGTGFLFSWTCVP